MTTCGCKGAMTTCGCALTGTMCRCKGLGRPVGVHGLGRPVGVSDCDDLPETGMTCWCEGVMTPCGCERAVTTCGYEGVMTTCGCEGVMTTRGCEGAGTTCGCEGARAGHVEPARMAERLVGITVSVSLSRGFKKNTSCRCHCLNVPASGKKCLWSL